MTDLFEFLKVNNEYSREKNPKLFSLRFFFSPVMHRLIRCNVPELSLLKITSL